MLCIPPFEDGVKMVGRRFRRREKMGEVVKMIGRTFRRRIKMANDW
jgi:hypothetical protein